MSVSEARPAGGSLLEMRNLRVDLRAHRSKPAPIIDGVDLSIPRGRRLALVGESGSGKSVTATATMGLLDAPLSSRVDSLTLADTDLRALSPKAWRRVRGRSIGLVQQDPATALSPVFAVGSQIAETVRRHSGLSRAAAARRAVECLAEVGIPDAARRARDFPHQLSGGLRQRVAIAIALSCEPELLLADEPTTALDVTVQAQVMDLLLGLCDQRGTGVLLITHDLAILPDFAHDAAVMYAGRIVERGAAPLVLKSPAHPYTYALLAAQPGRQPGMTKRRLPVVPGAPPAPGRWPAGCSFAARCPLALPVCREVVPPLEMFDGREVACHRAGEIAGIGSLS